MRGLERWFPQAVLSLVSALILYWFLPEIQYASISYNDAIAHTAIIRKMDEVWSNGGNILDFWFDAINFGHALLRSYQFLMHLVIWAMHKTLFSGMSLERCFNTCITLAAMALPWSFYKGARLLELSRLQAVIAGVAVVMIHEADGYGIGLTNFTFSGYGTYSQLFALLTFPLCVGWTHQMIRTRKHAVAASLAFAATFMSHILMGYFAALWIAIDLISARKFPVKTLAKFSALCLLWTAHWLLPMAKDNIWQNRSQYETATKWTGPGAEKLLSDLFTGRILDADRISVMTWLAAAGVVYCLFRKRHLAVQALAWLALSFGPATWGGVMSLLPFSRHLHWHRAFGVAEVALVFTLAAGLGAFFSWVPARRRNIAALTVFSVALLAPCLKERQNYFYYVNAYWLKDTVNNWNKDRTKYHEVLEFARSHSDARYNVGTTATWGNKLLVTSYIPLYGLLTTYNIDIIGSVYHHQNHSETLAFKTDWQNPLHNSLMNVRYIGLHSSMAAPRSFKLLLNGPALNFYDAGDAGGYFAVGHDHSGGCADNEGLVRAVNYYLQATWLGQSIFPEMKLAKACDETRGPLLETAITSISAEPSRAAAGSVIESGKTVAPESDRHWARIKMQAPGVAVFKMNYHPNWRALVNGKAADVHMVLPAYSAIRLTAGEHLVEFQYKPDRFKRTLLWLTLALWICATAYVLARRFRR